MPSLGRVLSTLLPALCATALLACSGSRLQECSALMNHINTGLTALENGRQQQKNDPTKTFELRAMADSLEETAKKTKDLSLATPELKALAQRYEAMTLQIAKDARGVAEAYEKNDAARLTKAQTTLNETLKLEDPIIDDLNKFCSQ